MNIKELRIKAGITQTQAAKLVGASLRAWQSWESDKPSARECPSHIIDKFKALTGEGPCPSCGRGSATNGTN
jgi:transcriptional regulator with XRE-family HTH domain